MERKNSNQVLIAAKTCEGSIPEQKFGFEGVSTQEFCFRVFEYQRRELKRDQSRVVQCELNKRRHVGILVSLNHNYLHVGWGRDITVAVEIKQSIAREGQSVRVFLRVDTGIKVTEAISKREWCLTGKAQALGLVFLKNSDTDIELVVFIGSLFLGSIQHYTTVIMQ